VKKFSSLVLSIAVLSSFSSVAVSGVKIGGNATQNVKAKNTLNMANGKNAQAKQEIGSVKGNVKIGGNLKQNVNTKNTLNMANGKNAKASQSIGTISSSKH